MGKHQNKQISKNKRDGGRERAKTDHSNDLILCVGVNVCLSVIHNYLNLQCAVEHPHQR